MSSVTAIRPGDGIAPRLRAGRARKPLAQDGACRQCRGPDERRFSMKAQRVKGLTGVAVLGSAAAALASFAASAAAQVSDSAVLNIMRECAKIDDPSARLACYDNNI